MTPPSDSELILNVDDTEAARYAKSRILTRAGFRVIEAGNGTDALEMVASHKPALVLLDVKLPDINGFEVCRQIKTNLETQMVLVLQTSASYIGTGDKIRALEGGADNYLFEPIEPEELVANVRALLRLSKVERELRESDRRKNEFLAMLAHELRNPLGPIRSAVELLRHLEPNSSRLQENAREIILRQTDHMVRLIDDLLDVARVSQGKIHLRLEDVDVKSIIQAAVESARAVIDRYQHRLTVDLPGQDLRILGDSVRLAQVVSNLLTNAAKFTPQEGELAIKVRREGDEVAIRVTDNGIGLSSDDANSIFMLFAQAGHLPDRVQEGLGIGLALVKTLVEMHHGRVSASSGGAGSGSAFEIRLPALAEAAAPAPEQQSVSFGTARHRILIVDDNIDAADTLGALLEIHGHVIGKAYSGKAALDAARAFRPQIVILDIGLPDMTGFDVARKLRSGSETTGSLLIALTGYGQEADKNMASDAGFDGHLTKPVSFDALSELMQMHFSQAAN
ncbi:ATP-binding response regulator [Noviherbaspirillum galbum]|uniref:histidine kinase n=1 Tax=Noviherbaspirillum galbum TaxID=2709383 RepID=A0A6B3SFU6_9BURK|nr:response regulator [Noviherbaspirillum galbum]NEX59453.1 response regulator [Noviherbaspirillum galbum]